MSGKNCGVNACGIDYQTRGRCSPEYYQVVSQYGWAFGIGLRWRCSEVLFGSNVSRVWPVARLG